jgi:hypothetical protein
VGQKVFSSVEFQIIYNIDQQKRRLGMIRGMVKVVRTSHHLCHRNTRTVCSSERNSTKPNSECCAPQQVFLRTLSLAFDQANIDLGTSDIELIDELVRTHFGGGLEGNKFDSKA